MPGLSKVKSVLSRVRRNQHRRSQSDLAAQHEAQSEVSDPNSGVNRIPGASKNCKSSPSTSQQTVPERGTGEVANPGTSEAILSNNIDKPGNNHVDVGLGSGYGKPSLVASEGERATLIADAPQSGLQESILATQPVPEKDSPPTIHSSDADEDRHSSVAPTMTGKVANGSKSIAAKRELTRVPEPFDQGKYWATVQTISHENLAALANSVVRPKNGEFEPNYQVTGQSSGAFNCGYFLESPYGEKLVVRVPATGHPDRWNEVDARMLRDGALGMQYLRKKTDLPVPQLIHYDTTLNNQISAPYMLMSFVEGTSLLKAWHGSGDDDRTREAKRQTILRSIASIMPRFRSVTFKDFGALCFEGRDDENPVIDDAVRLTVEDIFTIKREFRPIPTSTSLKEFIADAKVARYQDPEFPRNSSDPLVRGFYVLWEMMLDAFMKVASLEGEDTEDFVLMQSDFNPQNIMVDDGGKVIGLIDWDCIETVPRQVGWCVVPHWLAEDWNDDYHWPVQTASFEEREPDSFERYLGLLKLIAPDDFDRYRRDYTRYLKEACAGTAGDEKYTSKSHIYRALLASHETFERVKSFVCNVLVDILPRNAETLMIFVGDVGTKEFCEGQKAWMEGRLARYLRPDAATHIGSEA